MRKGVDRWQTSFLMWDCSIPGQIMPFFPENLRNENADTCQAIAFLCLHIFILLCANIIPKATDTVKETTRGMEDSGVTLLAKKMLRHNGFSACFLRENVKPYQGVKNGSLKRYTHAFCTPNFNSLV